jgi:RNA polymerase sigma-70 factor (ECF subfamily)
MPRETATLVREATRGDALALEELLVLFLPELTAFLRLRQGPLLHAHESASDLAQSVCREVLGELGVFEYRGEQAFRRWLFLHAERLLVDRARYWGAQRRDVAREATPTEAEMHGVVTLLTPSRIAAGREDLAAFWRLLDELPLEQRSVLALCRGLGMTPSEAATELGKTANAVRVTLHRGLARLAMLEEREQGRTP